MKNFTKIIQLFSIFLLSFSIQAQNSFQVEGKSKKSIRFGQQTNSGNLGIGIYYSGGVVVGVTKDGKHTMIVTAHDECNTEFEPIPEDEGNPNCNPVNFNAAKQICHGLSIIGIDDWELPTFQDLQLIKKNLYDKKVGEIEKNWYWVSETSGGKGTIFNMKTGASKKVSKSEAYNCRCIRTISDDNKDKTFIAGENNTNNSGNQNPGGNQDGGGNLTNLPVANSSPIYFKIDGRKYRSVDINQRTESKNLSIGDSYTEGIIVGIAPDNGHGLIVSSKDICKNESSPCTKVSLLEAKNICEKYKVKGIDDWTLPNESELKLIKDNLFKNGVGVFKSKYYHSSNGSNTNKIVFKSNVSATLITGVRCVRSF